MKNKIIIIGGDAQSINSEIICKMWKKANRNIKKNIYLITNFEMFKSQINKLGYKIDLAKVSNINEKSKINRLKILNINMNFKNCFKVSKRENSNFVIKSLIYGHKLGLESSVKGIINCPIDKNLLKKTKKIGVTEFLAFKNNVKNQSEVMLIHNKTLSVVPITTHVKIEQINKKITKEILKNKIRTIHKSFKFLFNKYPKIAILGLNPHNSEFDKNSKEVKIIKPIIIKLKKEGKKIEGPFAADTIFIKDYKNYDVIVGMYHDQVLGPFKTIYKFDAINVTLGLKYIRVSPDHGTAKNLIKKNIASPLSLIRCVEFINKLN